MKKLFHCILDSTFYLLLPLVSFAAEPQKYITTAAGVESALTKIGNWIYSIFIIIAIIMIVITAFQFLTAAGDPAKLKKAKDSLIYTAIAVAIAAFSKSIVAIVQSIAS